MSHDPKRPLENLFFAVEEKNAELLDNLLMKEKCTTSQKVRIVITFTR